jgi:hypothetical protein
VLITGGAVFTGGVLITGGVFRVGRINPELKLVAVVGFTLLINFDEKLGTVGMSVVLKTLGGLGATGL